MEECPVGTHPDRFDIDPEEGEHPGQRDLLEGAVVGLGDNGQQRLCRRGRLRDVGAQETEVRDIWQVNGDYFMEEHQEEHGAKPLLRSHGRILRD